MELESIPGIGQKTASSLRELDDPVGALKAGDVAALSQAPGITTGQAAHIARSAIQAEHDDPGDFLATDRARSLYEELLALVQSYATTDYGTRRLETLYPSAVDSRIEEVRTFVEGAIQREATSDVIDALEEVAPLEHPRPDRVRDRCLATADAETYQRARDAVPELSVELIEDRRELADIARGYATVIVLDEAFAGVDVDGDIRVLPDALERIPDVVPERTLAYFGANKDRIHAAIEALDAAGLDVPVSVPEIQQSLARVDEAGRVVGDEELTRLRNACDDLDAATSTAESVANDQLKAAIQDRDVTVEGADLLTLVERGAGVDSLLDRELADELDAATDNATAHLVDALELTDHEADLAAELFPAHAQFPIERDEPAYERLEASLDADRAARATEAKRELADRFVELREAVEATVSRALELDVELAISRFAREHDCVMPTFVDQGIHIEEGRALTLDVAPASVEPVTYTTEGVTLLTGVNSGGKTSTLDLLATVSILAHMGLPVPASSARVRRVDRLVYHAKSRGTLDAGAFEATVREFATLASSGTNSLILVDELESITEPGASARLVAGFLEALEETDATAVFVTHLADEIDDVADIELAIDGIEAEGLDDGELVVDRSPRKGHLARSTPELIVEKLATEADDPAFFEMLLEKFASR